MKMMMMAYISLLPQPVDLFILQSPHDVEQLAVTAADIITSLVAKDSMGIARWSLNPSIV